MAYAAVTFLLNNVKNLLSHHIRLISDEQDQNQLNQLGKELDNIEDYLNKASYIINKNELLIEWERQIKEVVYQLEDAIDHYITQYEIGKRNFLRKHLSPRNRLGLAKEVKSLREQRLKPLIENGKIAVESLPKDAFDTSADEERGQRIKAPRQDNVVGFEDEAEKIIGYLLEESTGLEVISITGMPGLGKTTLAWKIYQDPKIQYEFPTLIWVYVSQNFNVKDMLLTILKKFTHQDLSSKSTDELAQEVSECLERGKFLIVMDDVWTIEAWNEIQVVLPKHNNMARVLITSRQAQVALHANHQRRPHCLRFLTKEESWKLLLLEVFGKLNEFPLELEDIGKYIASQCDGLPHAIVVIGGVLIDTLSTIGDIERNWRKVSKNIKTYLDEGIGMENIISWSYLNLPNDLRECFLYLGMFPAETEIQAWELTNLWIAEGFIKKKQEKTLEETAHDNLNYLINRNLVVVETRKLNGEVKTCLVQHPVHEFCKAEAALGRQNLFQEISLSKEGLFEPDSLEIEKYRRHCIHSYVEDFLSKKLKVPRTRSILCFSKYPINLESKDISSVTYPFELLRVFHAKSIKFPKFPVRITLLIHLKYLTLSGDEMKMLPVDISNLWNLQTLTVDTLCMVLEIKANLWNMLQLRHVKTKASIILNRDARGNGGENLQTLSKLSPQSCTEDLFKKAKNLKTLGVRGKLDELESKCLEKLELLKKLKLVNYVFPNIESENPLQRLPCTFPTKLKFLTLSATYLGWTHMSAVGNIPNLEMLKLKDNAFAGDSWDVVDGGFHHLEFLYIEQTDLMLWRAEGDAFPKLRSLVLKNCEKLQSVPNDLVRKLEMLSLERVTAFAVKSAKEVEMERKQVEKRQKIKMGVFKLIIAPEDEFSGHA